VAAAALRRLLRGATSQVVMKCSHLFYRLKKGPHYALPVGLFDDVERWALKHQVFIDEKPSWYAFANDTENLTGAEVFAKFGAPGG
jgi:hypothetical protein